MAKELPYFKFEPNQWDNGNIQMCSDIAKAHFINICSAYWSRLGSLSDRFAIAKCCSGNNSTFDELLENQIIKVNDEGLLMISFLDSQLSDFMDIKKARSESGKKGGQNGGVRPEVERINGNQLYLLVCSGNNEQFLKLGTTSNSISRRYSGKMPYEYSVIFQLLTDDYLKFESEYCELFAKYEYRPKLNFQGQKECYSILFLSEIKNILEQRHNIAIAPLKRNETIREEKIIVEEKKKEEKSDPLRAIVDLLSGQLKVSFLEWIQFRKEKGVKITPSTAKKQIAFLGGRDPAVAVAIINQSITMGWTGLFELKSTINGNGKQNNGLTKVQQQQANNLQSLRDQASTVFGAKP